MVLINVKALIASPSLDVLQNQSYTPERKSDFDWLRRLLISAGKTEYMTVSIVREAKTKAQRVSGWEQ